MILNMIQRVQPVKLFHISPAACLITLCYATQGLDLFWFLVFIAENCGVFSTWLHNFQIFLILPAICNISHLLVCEVCSV